MELKLIRFIKEHNNWEELLTKEPYNLRIARDDGYILFKYSQIGSDFNNEIVRECRGIILREGDFKPVCVPFFKFGNYGESYCPEINWLSASVQQKIDGSLMKLWYDDGWHLSTNGTIDAFKADLPSLHYDYYGELFSDACDWCEYHGAGREMIRWLNNHNVLDKNYTYMFELVSPENRIVIEYKYPEVYFLGARDMRTFEEVLPEFFAGNNLLANNKIPERYDLHSLEDVREAASTLPWDEEGYVVCDKYFNRVKIKSPEYVRVHHLSNNKCVTAERLVSLVLENEVDELLSYYPSYAVHVNLIKTKLAEFKQKIYSLIAEINPESFASRKDYAEVVKTKPNKYQMFLFKYNDLENQFNKVSAARWVKLLEL